MSTQAALAGRNAVARALKEQSRAERERAESLFNTLNTQAVLSRPVRSLQEPIIQLIPAAREDLFADIIQTVIQGSDPIHIMETTHAIYGIFELSRHAPEPTIRTGSMNILEQLIQDPTKRGVLFGHMRAEPGIGSGSGSTSTRPFAGDHPILARYREFADFSLDTTRTEFRQILQRAPTHQVYESSIEELFHQRFPNRVYDPAYAVGLFVAELLFMSPYMSVEDLQSLLRGIELYQTTPFFAANDPWMIHITDQVRSYIARSQRLSSPAPSAPSHTVQMPRRNTR